MPDETMNDAPKTDERETDERKTEPAHDQWQTIDTVPHDAPVLVYTKPWGAIIATFSAEHGEWLSRMQVPVSIKHDEELPTHWRPLPEAPEGAAKEEGVGEAA